jgi:hypothetical protein
MQMTSLLGLLSNLLLCPCGRAAGVMVMEFEMNEK